MKCNPVSLSLLALGLAMLASCSSSTTYQQQFNSKNRVIIRHVLEAGAITCQNRTSDGSCLTISDSLVTTDKYELTGKSPLYTWHVSMESLSEGSRFKLHVNCQLMSERNETSEQYFLNEVTSALFNSK